MTRRFRISPSHWHLVVLGVLPSAQRAPLNLRNTLWLGYLLYISLLKNWRSGLLFPMWLGEIVNPMGAIVASNLIFAGLHYVTYDGTGGIVFFASRGMGFSHMLATYENLTLVILTHWLFTFFNTPAPPRTR